jgi:hypothetical protein
VVALGKVCSLYASVLLLSQSVALWETLFATGGSISGELTALVEAIFGSYKTSVYRYSSLTLMLSASKPLQNSRLGYKMPVLPHPLHNTMGGRGCSHCHQEKLLNKTVYYTLIYSSNPHWKLRFKPPWNKYSFDVLRGILILKNHFASYILYLFGGAGPACLGPDPTLLKLTCFYPFLW